MVPNTIDECDEPLVIEETDDGYEKTNHGKVTVDSSILEAEGVSNFKYS
ncbi:hypothetical protein PPL_02436 [Heterostelium album PN500]|uniref:Uncharacterized protein n=1 Tax=Heterostelium pallidum (strain ATCC 26659 / Pp 5 / PN500) TaxID=670386 RepID=D3AZQ2_HETP5|nr:hypothetical protein PPL_02436 [Heterostelium album PN500]EFA85431.1 hypothetical protein PPL_02436 [Heterostelium album PN500]|eukprot:XP_020437540.1 hypothetical protein PPL_02436 [Heterostelium album PN500]